ncbi:MULTISPECIES: TRAP transporter large permease [Thalassospira]|jgi:tripartite ATP-independent transporter DctM subunit|uniref:TRAP transporter large permease protein n=1 Tax=Thalassospira lucentensis TaxID=168935 RepID=A0A358HQJ0_9PROT|nr:MULTISPECIES: TRAP transporter large permease subunit [Thalassospira]MBV17804.1 C4-dicarboxylate ABC transporter [Thalassospira sp.]RCK19944.1 C4-dicarboxylate ABC transporter [Thalassospira lucentensis MCCC 1A00383 = DSM 14000]HBU97420.1 C4-dicarboxylate ABC transporter [Thalassospira lucentensis]HCW67912.1 C4-dicarboxylate ABC transporter [Thalassospira lucentensis]|tara:strand:- start:11720 stop:13111 length:1392 start_codon:yes stop_codon:yes gene_type:complete
MDNFYIEDWFPLFMFACIGIFVFTGLPVAFVISGIGIAFGFLGMAYDVFSFIEFFNIVSRIWGGIAENMVMVAVPMFIFMGTMLEKSGVAEDLLECLNMLLRKVPGGLALSVTLMGTIMAATTGIIGASVVMMTLLALPVMLRRNYDPSLATGTIAASGTLGILIPPSIMLVLMSDLLSISVGNLFLASIIPGLLLASLYTVYIFIRCQINPSLAPPLPEGEAVHGKDLVMMMLRSFLPPVFLIVLVLGSIFAGFATPTEAAGVGAVGATFLALVKGRLKWPVLKDVCERSALTGAMLFFLFAGATVFSYVFRSLGGDDLVIDLVEQAGLGSWGILLLLMLIVFILGFFFDWVEITLIVLPIFAPVIAQLDFGHHLDVGGLGATETQVLTWFAVLVAVNLQTSFLTPPFGFALFYLKGVAPKSISIQQIYKGIIPFVLLQVIGLILVMAFPEIALWMPNTLLE